MMQMLISLCGDSDASYLTLMLMLIDLNTDFVHTDLCIRIYCYIILCLFYIHYIQFEIPSVLENQSFGNSNLNTVNVLHLAMYSFQRLWRSYPSAKSSKSLNVHLFRYNQVNQNKTPIQIHAKQPKIEIPPNIVHAKYNTFTVISNPKLTFNILSYFSSINSRFEFHNSVFDNDNSEETIL